MWDKNKIYKIGFFKWQANGDIWISNDPVDPDRRWIIRQLDIKCARRFSISYYCLAYDATVEYGESESHVAMAGYCNRLKQISDFVYSSTTGVNKEQLELSKELISFYEISEDLVT